MTSIQDWYIGKPTIGKVVSIVLGYTSCGSTKAGKERNIVIVNKSIVVVVERNTIVYWEVCTVGFGKGNLTSDCWVGNNPSDSSSRGV